MVLFVVVVVVGDKGYTSIRCDTVYVCIYLQKYCDARVGSRAP